MNRKRTFLIPYFIIASAAAIIVRYLQFAGEIINFDTGFFHTHAGAGKHIYYIILLLALGGLVALAVTERRRRTRFFNKRLGHFDDTDLASGGIMLLLAGFAVVYTAVRAGITNLGTAGVISAVLGVAAYGFAGSVLLFRKRTYPSVGIAFLVLSVHYIIRLVGVFMANHIILNMTEQLMVLVLLVMFSLFYLSLGRMFMRAESKTTRVKACVFGIFAAIVAVSEITAKMIYWLGSASVIRENLQRATSEFIMPDMLFAAETIALITLLLCMVRYKKSNG
jgi:hypothetical protein